MPNIPKHESAKVNHCKYYSPWYPFFRCLLYYVTSIILAPSGSQEAKMILERAHLGNHDQIRGNFLLFLALFGFRTFALIF